MTNDQLDPIEGSLETSACTVPKPRLLNERRNDDILCTRQERCERTCHSTEPKFKRVLAGTANLSKKSYHRVAGDGLEGDELELAREPPRKRSPRNKKHLKSNAKELQGVEGPFPNRTSHSRKTCIISSSDRSRMEMAAALKQTLGLESLADKPSPRMLPSSLMKVHTSLLTQNHQAYHDHPDQTCSPRSNIHTRSLKETIMTIIRGMQECLTEIWRKLDKSTGLKCHLVKAILSD